MDIGHNAFLAQSGAGLYAVQRNGNFKNRRLTGHSQCQQAMGFGYDFGRGRSEGFHLNHRNVLRRLEQPGVYVRNALTLKERGRSSQSIKDAECKGRRNFVRIRRVEVQFHGAKVRSLCVLCRLKPLCSL